MEEWSDERTKAYIRYIHEDLDNIAKQKATIKELEERIEERKKYIKSIEKSMQKTRKELAEQGIYV